MKNFIPRGNKTRRERVKKEVSKTYPFSACVVSVINDININLIYRNLACFAGKDFYIIGSNKWHRGATNGLEEIIRIKYFQNFNKFFQYIDKETNYKLVAVEQAENSISIENIDFYPENICFVFGNEAFGLTSDVLLKSNMTIEIPMKGFHPCLNVSNASAIIFYDFIKKMKNEM